MSLSSFFSCSSTRRKNNRHQEESMRIADVLSEENYEEEEEEEEEEELRRRRVLHKDPSLSSRSMTTLSRWFSKRRLAGPDPPPPPPPPPTAEAAAGLEASAGPGGKREELSFNLGMGIGLVFLLAKSATEVNKMTELRAQMEMLLKEVRTEIRREYAICSSSKSSNKVSDSITSSSGSSNNISISPSQCCGDASTRMMISKGIYNMSYDLEGVKHTALYKNETNYVTATGNTRSVSLDKMEAELELELQRLEMNLGGESSSAHQQRMEVDNEKEDPSFESFSVTYEEEVTIPQDTREYNGVSAHELERRLHELVATRQQEQIAELQSKLERMEQKLREKEIELCWWKETKCSDLQNEDVSHHSNGH